MVVLPSSEAGSSPILKLYSVKLQKENDLEEDSVLLKRVSGSFGHILPCLLT